MLAASATHIGSSSRHHHHDGAYRHTALRLQRGLFPVIATVATQAVFLALSLHAAQPLAADARALPLPATVKTARRPAESCSLSLTTGRRKTYTFSHCYAAEGGFSILWNHTADGSDSLISFGVQKKWTGWTAFGTSPGGEPPLERLPLASSTGQRARHTHWQAGSAVLTAFLVARCVGVISA